jgi:hypothetical protein
VFFGELKRKVARKLYKNQEELIKGIAEAIEAFEMIYF